jgi:hypothetical protein
MPQVRQKGHWVCDRRSKLKKEAAYGAQEELLMLITATPRIEPQWTPATDASNTVDMAAPIRHLREGKVFAQLSEKEEHDNKSWIYDTGATKHMSGSRVAFIELNGVVRGTVRFNDDLVAEIEGHESAVFICKNGECCSFTGVYIIPHLMVNIISVSQPRFLRHPQGVT